MLPLGQGLGRQGRPQGPGLELLRTLCLSLI